MDDIPTVSLHAYAQEYVQPYAQLVLQDSSQLISHAHPQLLLQELIHTCGQTHDPIVTSPNEPLL